MNKLRVLKEVIYRLSYIFDSKQIKRTFFVFLSMLLGAFFELLGVSIILPFVQVLLEPESISHNKYVVIITDFLNIQTTYGLTFLIGISIILVYVLKNVVLLLSEYCQIVYRNDLRKDLSNRMLRTYMDYPYEYFIERSTAEINRGVSSDIQGVCNIIEDLSRLVAEIITVGAIGLYILATDFIMAVGIILVAVICALAITFGMKKKVQQSGIQHRAVGTAMTKSVYQIVAGIKEITVMQRVSAK